MKHIFLILALLLLFISCSNKDESDIQFKISGRYTHQIIGCDNTQNPEINCFEFVNFMDNSTADVLTGGGDLIIRTKYHVDNNKIVLEKVGGLNFDISFKIQDKSTLNRIEDEGIWVKKD